MVYDSNHVAQLQSHATGAKMTDTFTYTVSDEHGGSASATATVTVAGVNDAPVISSNGGGDSAATSFHGNTTAVTTVAAVDHDGAVWTTTGAAHDADTVQPTLAGPGTVDLTSQLLGRAVVFTGSGCNDAITTSSGNDTVYGGVGSDTLTGGLGNDNLYGGAGNDNLTGGLGDDLYSVDSIGDVVTKGVRAGQDKVSTTLNSLVLAANVEIPSIVGAGAFTGRGNTLDNLITGGASNKSLFGGNGNDTLNGSSGADSLAAGGGNDV